MSTPSFHACPEGSYGQHMTSKEYCNCAWWSGGVFYRQVGKGRSSPSPNNQMEHHESSARPVFFQVASPQTTPLFLKKKNRSSIITQLNTQKRHVCAQLASLRFFRTFFKGHLTPNGLTRVRLRPHFTELLGSTRAVDGQTYSLLSGFFLIYSFSATKPLGRRGHSAAGHAWSLPWSVLAYVDSRHMAMGERTADLAVNLHHSILFKTLSNAFLSLVCAKCTRQSSFHCAWLTWAFYFLFGGPDRFSIRDKSIISICWGVRFFGAGAACTCTIDQKRPQKHQQTIMQFPNARMET